MPFYGFVDILESEVNVARRVIVGDWYRATTKQEERAERSSRTALPIASHTDTRCWSVVGCCRHHYHRHLLFYYG